MHLQTGVHKKIIFEKIKQRYLLHLFSLTLFPQNAQNRIFGISKVSGGTYIWTPLSQLASSGETGLAQIYAPCYAALDANENFCKNPDQISRTHRSRVSTVTALLVCKSASLLEILLKKMTARSNKYKHRNENENQQRLITQYIFSNISEGTAFLLQGVTEDD